MGLLTLDGVTATGFAGLAGGRICVSLLFGLTGLGCRDGATTLLTGLGDFAAEAAADFRGLTRRVEGVMGFLGTSASSSASASASGVSGLILGVHDELFAGGARTKGFGVPWGVAEKMLAKGCCGLEHIKINLCRSSHKGAAAVWMLTTRTSVLGALRMVRGVLPRCRPGVLKISVMFLFLGQLDKTISVVVVVARKRHAHLVLAREDVVHVLIQPIHLIARCIRELFDFLRCDLERRCALFCNPCCRPDGQTWCLAHRHFGVCLLCRQKSTNRFRKGKGDAES